MNPLTEAQLRAELRGDEGEVLRVYIACCEHELAPTMPWITTLSPARQTVIYSLYFNVGLGNPARFEAKWPHFLAQMQEGAYAAAADNLEASEPWASQVGPRARRLGELVRYG